ncbi:TIGR02611 family protein [Nonomuraea sp. MCN248]|uniref:TIGR02611 family protein n=1 Tax=Nonomuraea corallina TaxID=2989783 RepID=A0ABT4SFH7_9ACTN|nr:TIGR02611 family protein [Nonomuraea corallina]MDA0635968.1 TIGR02611 family protein [Nonomuraea corallina]
MPTQRSETGDADLMKEEAARHSSIPRRRGLKGRLDGIRATRTGALTLKIVIGVIGGLMVVGGLIMVPFPGPGWLVVFGGLAVLATEFHWAHKLLGFGRRTLHAWTEWYKRQGWTVRIIVLIVTLCAMGVIIYVGLRTVGVDVIGLAEQFLVYWNATGS